MVNQLQVYSVPKEAVKQEDFNLRIRPVGSEQWQQIEAYQVKVDMHDVREASMIYFDLSGKVELEITFPKFYTIYDVQIRPHHLTFEKKIETKKLTITIDKCANFSVEINKDKFHNLHVFAGAIEVVPQPKEAFLLNNCGNKLNKKLSEAPEGRLVYFERGIHYIDSFIWEIPSHTTVYLAPGAVLMGGIAVVNAEDVHIYGRGVIYQGHLDPQYHTNGFSIQSSQNIKIEGVTFINPLHYTISFGKSKNVYVQNVKTFSCHGWSDGFDMMSSEDITIENCFLRTSDDCIAIYGSRWENNGDSRNITIKDTILWADVAHPINIGTHGGHERDGDNIENVKFENIDILEHHEFQENYLGAISLNAGDKNIIRGVIFEKIRIDAFEHGRVFDIQVKWNKDYNPAPGRMIEDVMLRDIFINSGTGEEISIVKGYDELHLVKDIRFENIYRDGHKTSTFEEANIFVGEHTENITLN